MSNVPSADNIPDDSYKINPLALHIYKMFNQELVEKYEFLKIQLASPDSVALTLNRIGLPIFNYCWLSRIQMMSHAIIVR